MIRITRAHAQPIGVDFGFDSVKLLQLEVVGDHLSVVAAARQPLADDVREQPDNRILAGMETMRRLIRQNGFVGKHVVASLPRELVQVKNLRLPQMPTAEIEAAIQFEARNIFSFDIDQAQVRYLHAGEVRQGNDVREEVIVLAAKNNDVNDFLERLHRCGVVVESLDFEPCALYRGIERFVRRREDENEVHVAVDVGARRTQVVIGKGRDISFYKPIDIGGQHLQEAVVRKLGITPSEARALRRRLIESGDGTSEGSNKRDPVRQAVYDATRSIVEDLAREISLCLRYYSVTFRGHRPNRLRLNGGEACDPQLQATLAANLPLPVDATSPLQSVDMGRMKPADRRGFLSEWSVAFGLGLKKTSGHFGSPHGKRRDPAAPRDDLPTTASGAEVIDLSRAVHSASAPLETVPPPDARKAREVARA
jgi:type IV pilus assembly protein PilM